MVKHSNNILNNMKRGIKTFIHSILLMTVCLVLQACPEFGDTDPIGTVYIVNKSNETIFVGASQLLEAGDSLSLKNLSMEYFLTGKTESGDTTYVQSNLDGLKTYNSTFQIIILKSSTLNTHTGKELKEKMIVDKRYCFTYDDLAENDQTIIYTGD